MQTAKHDTYAPRRLGHANLFVTDWEKSADFYVNVVGLEEVYRRPKVEAAFLSNGNTHHDIAVMGRSGPAGRGLPPGLNHLGFELEHQAALVAAFNHASTAGVEAYTEDHDVARGLYLTDPDGNQVEIYADTVKDWRTQRHGTIMARQPDLVAGRYRRNPGHPVSRESGDQTGLASDVPSHPNRARGGGRIRRQL